MAKTDSLEDLARQGWIWEKDWEQFLAIIGEENYEILREQSMPNPVDGKPMCRGDLLVSPMGLAWMEASGRTIH